MNPKIGHLHDGVILLLRPESFSFFLSYLNFVITKALICTKKQTLKDSGSSSEMMSSCKWPIVKLRTIPSWFRRHFVGSMFWYRETGATHLASSGYRWLQFLNNEGRFRSRDQSVWIFFFSSFLRLLYFSFYRHFKFWKQNTAMLILLREN